MAQSFERVEKAVNDKVGHLKDVAKMGDLAQKLGDEFSSAKTKLEANKDAIPKLLKGFDEVQIHKITQNAEVKEEAAKQKLSADVDKLIAMLKSESTITAAQPDKNKQGRENAPSDGSNQPTNKQETVTAAANISPELNTAVSKTIAEARTIMNDFQPKNKQEALAKFPLIEQKLTELIAHAEKVEAALPAGSDKTEIGKLKQELSGFKDGLIANKSTLEGLPDMMFGAAQGKLDEAKADARKLIARFEGVMQRNDKVITTNTPQAENNNTTDESKEKTDDKALFDQVTESKTLSEYLLAVLNKKFASPANTMSITIPDNYSLDQKNHWWFKNLSTERKEKDGNTDMPLDKYLQSGFQFQRYGGEDGIHELTKELRKDGKAVHYKLTDGVLTIEKSTPVETITDPSIQKLLEHIFTYKDVARMQSGNKTILNFSFPDRKDFETIYSESGKAEQPNIKTLRENLAKLGIQAKGMSFYTANNTLLIQI